MKPSAGASSSRRPATPVRRLALPAMAAGLGMYVFVHSPLLHAAARLAGHGGLTTPYFSASDGILLGPVMATAAAVTAIAAALTAAAVISRGFAVRPYEWPLAYGLAAFAFVVVPAAYLGGLAGWIGGALLRPPLGPVCVALPALVVTTAGVLRGWRPAPPRLPLRGCYGLPLVLAATAALLLGASALVSVGRPPTGFDALSYHAPMAVYFWLDGNIASLLDRAPGGFAMAHPGAAALWFGLLLSGFGEGAANLGQLPFALLGGAAVHAFSRRLGFARRSAMVAGLAFLIAPMVVVQAGIQVADVTAAALLMSGIALACAPAPEMTAGRAAMIGLAMGLAVTVKLAALPAAAVTLAFVAITSSRVNVPTRSGLTRVWMPLALAFVVAVAPWATRNAVRFGNPIYPAALPLLGRGVVVGDFEKKDLRFVPAAIAWPLYPLLEAHSDQSGIGPLFLIGAVPGVLAVASRRRRRPFQLYILTSATSLVAWWMLTQHEPRHLLFALGLAFAFLPATLMVVPRPLRRSAAVLLIVAAVFSALVTLDRALAPRAGEPADRARFYDDVWGVDPVVAGRNATEPLLYNTGYASLSYAGDYPLLGPSLQRVLLTVDTDASTQAIVALMQQHRVQYAYVPARPELQAVVEAKYPPHVFELAHVSTVAAGKRMGTKRYLFRLRGTASIGNDVARGEESPQ